ncbi:hypothetical protein C479_00135 [Halovivax asiaticus JCM 14624]|uniref:NYN domain-containing protein n=1 Tax=Halovivax asiaticus JCM 14624 TaxID=1227490 RepID=M0BX63_9EURY|nr:NYN domain-containing protein [Halovivax asiaticus]ELZ14269.1 hypothetical protein C479_00135 [Halovivax asiaticus JCM 14624]
MFESLLERVRSPSTGVGLVVDGPNVFREEFDVDLDELRDLGRSEGTLVVSRLYVNEHATPGLIQAAEARGFEVVVTSGDVDVRLAVDATALVTSERIGTLVVVSRDTDFKPVLERARVDGIETLAVAPGTYGRSDALQNAADRAITLDTSDETDG